MKACLVVLLFFVCSVLSQPRPPPFQRNLYPIWLDGFDTVWLDDMSFVNEIHVQNYPPDNWTFFIWGGDNIRTVYPEGHSYYVGSTPNQYWHLPFVDLHTLQNGTDIWGFGPVNSFGFNNPERPRFGYELDIAVISNRPNTPWRFAPLGFEGTFFSVRPLIFDLNILGYFAGFFVNPREYTEGIIHFGILRAWFNVSAPPPAPGQNHTEWNFDPARDIAVLVNDSQFITYNADFKPIIYHVWNISGDPTPNNTYTIVVHPGALFPGITTAVGSLNPNTSLVPTKAIWDFPREAFGNSYISSAAYYYPWHTIIVGLATPGMETGHIAFVHTFNLTTRGFIRLPYNYSDPKALVVDEFNATLYVGMNGGGAVLRISIEHMNITGYQRTPFYLARAWAGHSTPEHVYFVTNEQHSKVFRVSKHDFCSSECHEFGYCVHGHCVCAPGFEEKDHACRWAELIKDNKTIKKDKAGEAVLGVFFAIALLAAAAGWFQVWKAKRQGYQSV